MINSRAYCGSCKQYADEMSSKHCPANADGMHWWAPVAPEEKDRKVQQRLF
jgi:hypothetical protein